MNRLLFAASALPPTEARALVSVLCSSTRRVRQITSFERTRARLKRRFKKSLVRVLKFAKHETLRKLHRFMFKHRPLVGQDAPPGVAFDRDQLRQDLIQLMRQELPDMLDDARQGTLDALNYHSPWELPAQDVLDLIARRENLISGLPDELFADVQRELSEGMNQNESLADLSDRVLAIFDDFTSERADLIADTETSAAYAYAANASAEEAGVEYKQWIHSEISKVPREDHLAIDGLIVPFDEAFPVGDPPLMYPHDENGSAEDVINCNCIAIPATQEDYDAQEE